MKIKPLHIILIVLVTALLSTAGYMYYIGYNPFRKAADGETEAEVYEEGTDDASSFLIKLRTDTDILFSLVHERGMSWVTGEGENSATETIRGRSIEIKETQVKNVVKVTTYLEGSGFTANQENISDDPIGSFAGCENGKMKCMVYSGISFFSPEQDPAEIDDSLSFIKVVCALN